MTTAAEFVKDAKELPVMPPIAAEVMKRAEDADSDLKAMAQLISRDTALAVRVLKIANSSFYSMPRKIETIQQAIVLLGYTTLRSVVVAASIKDVFARYGLAERLLWEHAVAAGCAASSIAKRVGGFTPDEVFVSGLLHDVGKLVMHSEAERQYQEVMRAVYSEESSSVDAERSIFGFDHAEVGQLTLAKWNLPSRLSAAIAGHHDLKSVGRCEDDDAKPLAAVLQVADRLCLREGLGRRKPNPDLIALECEGAEVLGLALSDTDDLTQEFRQAYEAEREIFG